jgi:AraC-like DNA-binding protein
MSDTKPDSVKREWSLADGDFPFEIVHIGEPANNMSTFHWHDYMELSYIQKNGGRFEIEDRVYQVAKGDVVIINNIERHRVTYKGSKPLYETVIHFDPRLIWFREDPTMEYGYLKLFRHNRIAFNNRPELSDATKKELAQLFGQITAEYQAKKPFHKLLIKARLLTIIALLLRECTVEAVDDGVFLSKRNNIDRLKRILDFIEGNSRSAIGLESTAARFHFNASYFSDYFRKNVGITFSEYLSRVRVRDAIALMTEKSLSSTEAAYECGFNNIASFYAAFKRVTGMNPGAYLKSRG